MTKEKKYKMSTTIKDLQKLYNEEVSRRKNCFVTFVTNLLNNFNLDSRLTELAKTGRSVISVSMPLNKFFDNAREGDGLVCFSTKEEAYYNFKKIADEFLSETGLFTYIKDNTFNISFLESEEDND